MSKAFFITIEGGEGSGKGTLINNLKGAYPEFVFTREPGGTRISEQIREIIVGKDNTELVPEAEALLFAAARAQHMSEKIIPAIERGKTVVSDRFIDSNFAYQGYARGLGMDKIMRANELAIGGHMPDMTIYLDIDPEVAFKRIAENNRETNRLDLESMEFHKKVREGYLTVAEMHPKRYRIINADQTPNEVFEDVVNAIEELFKRT
jgi:dTMP kinase